MTEDPTSQEGIGCRGVTITAVVLVGIAAAMWTVGLKLNQSPSCVGACEWTSFALLFAGGPVSALFTVLGGTDLVIGWPVDIIAWVVLSTAHQKLSGEDQPYTSVWTRWVAIFVGGALVYGALMASFVGRAVQ